MLQKIKGYANIFHNKDSDGDITRPGTFSNWLSEEKSQHIQLYFGHEGAKGPWSTPIGVTTLIKEDEKGLYFEGVLANTEKSAEVVQLIKTGATIDSSFGYNVITRNGDILEELEVFEISVLARGANNLAFIELDGIIEEEKSEQAMEELYQKVHQRHLQTVSKNHTYNNLSKTIDKAILKIKGSPIDAALSKLKKINWGIK